MSRALDPLPFLALLTLLVLPIDAGDSDLLSIERSGVDHVLPGTGAMIARISSENQDSINALEIEVCHDSAEFEVSDIRESSPVRNLNDGEGPDVLIMEETDDDSVVFSMVVDESGGGEAFEDGDLTLVFRIFYDVTAEELGEISVELCRDAEWTTSDGDDVIPELTGLASIEVVDGPVFIRGDVDGNGTHHSLLDTLALLDYAFTGGDEPPCFDAADVDGDLRVRALVDGYELLSYAFTGGPAPPAPGLTCGLNPDSDTPLSCDESTCEL